MSQKSVSTVYERNTVLINSVIFWVVLSIIASTLLVFVSVWGA